MPSRPTLSSMPCSAPTSTPHLTPTSTPHLALLSMPHPIPSSLPHITSSPMPRLTPLSTAHHESSTHLIHPNQPLIPSPRLEKSRGELAREGEFLADQARLSVQASPKKKPILRSGLLCPNLYSFFLDQQSMWFLLVLIVPPAYNHPSLHKPHTPLTSLYLPTK